jgi:hypothetical protein
VPPLADHLGIDLVLGHVISLRHYDDEGARIVSRLTSAWAASS